VVGGLGDDVYGRGPRGSSTTATAAIASTPTDATTNTPRTGITSTSTPPIA
jgi:hypothetical protein